MKKDIGPSRQRPQFVFFFMKSEHPGGKKTLALLVFFAAPRKICDFPYPVIQYSMILTYLSHLTDVSLFSPLAIFYLLFCVGAVDVDGRTVSGAHRI